MFAVSLSVCLSWGAASRLGSEDYPTRTDAAAALEDLGGYAVPALLAAEASADPEVRHAACLLLDPHRLRDAARREEAVMRALVYDNRHSDAWYHDEAWSSDLPERFQRWGVANELLTPGEVAQATAEWYWRGWWFQRLVENARTRAQERE